MPKTHETIIYNMREMILAFVIEMDIHLSDINGNVPETDNSGTEIDTSKLHDSIMSAWNALDSFSIALFGLDASDVGDKSRKKGSENAKSE